ncbi:MAG TPA: outer membrane beta-barrel protein [Candidatus Eisenbacteria bacterium]|nr:outer membrane beta-barrel protein [Candidatus Eisenbacteria bacterium]
MKKRVALLVLTGSFLLASAAQAAPDRVGHLEVGVQGGYSMNDKIDDTGFVLANVDYGLTPYFAVGFEGGWEEADGDPDETVGIVHLMGDLIVRSPDFHENFVPYGVLGLGVIGGYVTDTEGVEPNNSGADSYESSFAWKLGVGVEYLLSPNWALNFEIAYYGTSVDLPNSTLGDDSLDHWKIGGGAKYIF